MILKLSFPAPFHDMSKSPPWHTSAGRSSVVSPKMTLLENPVILGLLASVPTSTVATLKFSFPDPFQLIYRLPPHETSDGESEDVSLEMCLRAKLAPLSVETITFKLSFPEPLNARYRLPLCEAMAGLVSLVSPRITLFESDWMSLVPEALRLTTAT